MAESFSQSLQHDTAFVLALHNMEIVRECAMDKGQDELFGRFYTAARAAIEAFIVQHNRLQRRMNPTAK
jgi:hypothetical protein